MAAIHHTDLERATNRRNLACFRHYFEDTIAIAWNTIFSIAKKNGQNEQNITPNLHTSPPPSILTYVIVPSKNSSKPLELAPLQRAGKAILLCLPQEHSD